MILAVKQGGQLQYQSTVSHLLLHTCVLGKVEEEIEGDCGRVGGEGGREVGQGEGGRWVRVKGGRKKWRGEGMIMCFAGSKLHTV